MAVILTNSVFNIIVLNCIFPYESKSISINNAVEYVPEYIL